MTPRLSAEEARVAFMNRAGEVWDQLDSSLMGETIPLILAQGGLGATADCPCCEQCGCEMVFKGYEDKGVEGLEGEGRLPRAYYWCSGCGAGVFPPGS